MSNIPENNFDLVKELGIWFSQKAELAKLKATEMTLRKRIFGFVFPAPREGSNNHTLPDGYILNGQHIVDRKVDEAALKVLLPKFREAGIKDEVVVWKPELAKSKYNELTEEQKHLFDQCLVVKPGSPSMEVKPPSTKAKAGEQAG